MKLGARRITADTMALILFSFATGIFGLLFERLELGLSLVQMTWIRVAYNVLKWGLGVIPARIMYAFRAKLKCDGKLTFKRAMTDGAALSVYQIPLYVLCALSAQAEWKKLGEAVVFYLLNNQAFGWIYGIIVDRARARLAVRSPEHK